MIKAVSTIIAGDKVFMPGQLITGLSPVDREWMKAAGYIMEEQPSADLKTETEIRAMTRKDDVIAYAESIGLNGLTSNSRLDELKEAVLKYRVGISRVEDADSRQIGDGEHDF